MFSEQMLLIRHFENSFCVSWRLVLQPENLFQINYRGLIRFLQPVTLRYPEARP